MEYCFISNAKVTHKFNTEFCMYHTVLLSMTQLMLVRHAKQLSDNKLLIILSLILRPTAAAGGIYICDLWCAWDVFKALYDHDMI